MTPNPGRRVYFISPWRRAVLWWIFGPFLLFGAAVAIWGDGRDRGAGVAVMVVMGILLAAWQWLVTRTRLVLTAEGVQLHQLAMRIDARWQDVETLRLVRGREGFVTSVPLQGKGVARLAALRGLGIRGAPLYSEEQRAFMTERRWIPIEPFGWYLRRGELAADIARLAPHVATSVEPPPSAEQTRKNAAALFMAVAIVVVILSAAVALAMAPEDVQDRVEFIASRSFTVVFALIAPLLTWRTAWSTRNAFRERSVLIGILFGCLTLILACWCLVAWQGLAGLWQ